MDYKNNTIMRKWINRRDQTIMKFKLIQRLKYTGHTELNTIFRTNTVNVNTIKRQKYTVINKHTVEKKGTSEYICRILEMKKSKCISFSQETLYVGNFKLIA